ncbi:hypothetical protein [Haloarchaeobius sp. HRN-SO-5]|uniref:hypothetical protein n=1 Tax=Haloarchaeobius sp. HRN-SO-5 TaxID=3446118 RepID=UPI003EBFC78B
MPSQERYSQASVPAQEPARESVQCPGCTGATTEMAVYEHPACGFVGFYGDCRTESGPTCPKCSEAIEDPEELDRLGELYVCVDCERRFELEDAQTADDA